MQNKTIEKAIKACGSQFHLALTCGVSQPTVSYWLNGGGINSKYIPLIAKATNGEVSESELLQSLTSAS